MAMSHEEWMIWLEVHQSELTIWRKYRQLKSECKVLRSGCLLYGACEKPDETKARPESDAEHTFGVMALIMLMRWCYPEQFQIFYLSPVAYASMLEMALLHEIGETEIGDIPDDGARDEAAKDAAEYAAFEKFTDGLPHPVADSLNYGFYCFQQKRRDGGLTLYYVDKFEAVLQALVYEADGHGGDLKNHDHPSERDLRNAERIGSTKMADIFAIGLLDKIDEYGQVDLINLMMRDILKAAYLDVRGEVPDWLAER